MALPSGYTRLEYIQSSGTQYIDTGFKPNQDTRVVAKAKYTQPSTATYLFGTDAGSGQAGFSFGSANGNLRQFYNKTSTYFQSGLSFADPITIDANKNVCSINDTYTVNGTYATFSPGYSMYLFAANRAGSIYGICTATIYSCQIYNNGTLVRDFIPCKNASGIIGLWDDVNSVFYENAGSGTFSAGPEIENDDGGGGGSEGKTYKVTITGTGNSDYTYVIIGGTKYYSIAEVSVSEGTEITFGQLGPFSTLTINGETISSTEDYTILATSDVEVALTFTWSGIKGTITVKLTNPMLPHDGHNTNIGQVAREIEGGTIRLSAVVREIESGITLAGGVAREILFSGGTVVITITGDGGKYASVQIGGSTYTSAMVIEVEAGTEVVFSAASETGITKRIILNGTTVASNEASTPVTYTMDAIEDMTVALKYERVIGNAYRGEVSITTG